jgi:hypothetical protein
VAPGREVGPAVNWLMALPAAMERMPSRWVLAILWGVGGLLAARLMGMTWLMAVDVPFSDQWSILRGLDDGFQWGDVLQAFRWQHGPHRQGLSFAFVLPGYHFSGWSVRLDSLLAAAEQLLAGLLLLRLRRKLLPGPWSLWDGILLLVFWGVCTFETILVATNASHSIFPLLLLMLLANVWLWPLGMARGFALSVLILCLTFTGFGITSLPVLVFVLMLQVWRCAGSARWHALWLLAACGGSMALFLQDHVFVVAADGFEAMRPNPLDYFHFVVAMFSHFLLMLHRVSRWILYPAGFVLLSGVVLAGLVAIQRLARPAALSGEMSDRRLYEVCLILIGCSLTFALLTAYGRVQLGTNAATASRYTALLMPALAGLLLLLLKQRKRFAPVLLALLLLFSVRVVPETRQAWLQSRYYSSMKLCWVEQYRVGQDFDAATATVTALDGFKTFQEVWMGSAGSWQMLREQGLGPFAADRDPPPFLRLFPRPCEVLQAP